MDGKCNVGIHIVLIQYRYVKLGGNNYICPKVGENQGLVHFSEALNNVLLLVWSVTCSLWAIH